MNLFGIQTIGEVERKLVARRSLANLLTSYADEADIFTEIVQNAFDAILKAKAEGLYSGSEKPKIKIIIGRRNEGHHYIFVSDNGTGMSSNVAQNLTVPGFSFGKKRGKTIGYKGVGASYFFAASQKIAFITIDQSGSRYEATVRGSYEWIKNDDEREPEIDATCEVPEIVRQYLPSVRGTGIFFQFHDGMRPKNLSNIVIGGDGAQNELKNWACFLASKTAIGVVRKFDDLNLEITLVLDLGNEVISQNWAQGDFDRETNVIGYPFPHKVLKNAKDVVEIDATHPAQKHVKHYRKYHAIHRRWSASDIVSITDLSDEERDKMVQYLESVEGYLAYSTDVIREINARLGGRSYLLRHGMRIAVDGIPQGRNIDLSLTSSQGLDRQSHIVLMFKGLELDTGRKITAEESVASGIAKIGRKIVDVLKDYRIYMRVKDRPQISSDLNTWRTSIESREQDSLVREMFRMRQAHPVFRVDPVDENEVISLFSSLAVLDILKGYRVGAFSGYARYDCLCDIDVNSTSVRNLDDSFSVRQDKVGLNGSMRVVEFKTSFELLLDDFEEGIKIPSEIDLVVCWDLPDLSVRRGRLEPTYGEWRDSRTVYGGTYHWFDENNTSDFPVLSLKTLIAELLAQSENAAGSPGIGTAKLRQIMQRDRDEQV